MSNETKPENPPAFPLMLPWDNGGHINGDYDKGMTLRDYFAAQALAGIRLTPDGPITECRELHAIAEQLAIGAYAIADAMLAQRGKTYDPTL